MLLTCLGATDYGDANAEATNEKEALDLNKNEKKLQVIVSTSLKLEIKKLTYWIKRTISSMSHDARIN